MRVVFSKPMCVKEERIGLTMQGLSKPFAKPPCAFCPVGAGPHKILPAFAEAEPADTVQCYVTKNALAHTIYTGTKRTCSAVEQQNQTRNQGCHKVVNQGDNLKRYKVVTRLSTKVTITQDCNKLVTFRVQGCVTRLFGPTTRLSQGC